MRWKKIAAIVLASSAFFSAGNALAAWASTCFGRTCFHCNLNTGFCVRCDLDSGSCEVYTTGAPIEP